MWSFLLRPFRPPHLMVRGLALIGAGLTFGFMPGFPVTERLIGIGGRVAVGFVVIAIGAVMCIVGVARKS